MKRAHMPTVSYVNCAENVASIHSTVSRERSTKRSALQHTKRKWKSPSPFNDRKRKPAAFASTLCGKKTDVNSASVFCPIAITASASSAFERGDKRNNLTTKSFEPVPSVASVPISCVQVPFGWTVRRRKRNSFLNTKRLSAKRIASTLRR